MAKLPFMKFFPKDWLADEKLRLCSLSARGFWMDLLCLMHSAPRRGYLQTATGSPLPLEQIARATGCSTDEATRLMQELKDAGVPDCTEHGIIYSRRMVREEGKRLKCAEAGKRGGNPTLKGHPKGRPKGGVKLDPIPSEVQKVRGSELSSAATIAVSALDDHRPAETGVITPPPVSEFVQAWNAAGLMKITATRKIRHLWQQYWAVDPEFRERWRAAVERAGSSPRCRGEDPEDPGYRLHPHFFLDPEQELFVRLLDWGDQGEYGPRTAGQRPPDPAQAVQRSKSVVDIMSHADAGIDPRLKPKEPPA